METLIGRTKNCQHQTLDELATDIHETAIEKGFWGNDRSYYSYETFGMKLALIHSEVTEVLEALRKFKTADEITDEFADIVIRTLDLYEGLRRVNIVDKTLQSGVELKVEVNKGRPTKHGNRF